MVNKDLIKLVDKLIEVMPTNVVNWHRSIDNPDVLTDSIVGNDINVDGLVVYLYPDYTAKFSLFWRRNNPIVLHYENVEELYKLALAKIEEQEDKWFRQNLEKILKFLEDSINNN